jgi:hypothetical protein
MYTFFNVMNTCSNNFVTPVIYGHFQSKAENIPTNDRTLQQLILYVQKLSTETIQRASIQEYQGIFQE